MGHINKISESLMATAYLSVGIRSTPSLNCLNLTEHLKKLWLQLIWTTLVCLYCPVYLLSSFIRLQRILQMINSLNGWRWHCHKICKRSTFRAFPSQSFTAPWWPFIDPAHCKHLDLLHSRQPQLKHPRTQINRRPCVCTTSLGRLVMWPFGCLLCSSISFFAINCTLIMPIKSNSKNKET